MPAPPVHVVNPPLASAIDAWMARRGRAPPPRLSLADRARAAAVFELMDSDGSGAVDGRELGDALQLLGIHLPPANLQSLIAAVDADGSGVLEFREFVTVLTRALAAAGAGTAGSAATALPFTLAFGAYLRRRLLAAMDAGDRGAVRALASKVEAGSGCGGGGDGGGPAGDSSHQVRAAPAPRQASRRPPASSPPPPLPALTATTWTMRPRPRMVF